MLHGFSNPMTLYLGLSAARRHQLEAAVRKLPTGTTCSPAIESPDLNPAVMGVVHRVAIALDSDAPLPDLGPDIVVTELDPGGSSPSPTTTPFLTPLVHLALPAGTAAGAQSQSLIANTAPDQPLWMGILNITPDSFSDGGRWTGVDHIEATALAWAEHGVHLIDIGAESTRPNAVVVDPEVEWRRIEPVLNRLTDVFADRPLRPLLSLDSRNVSTLERGVDAGIDLFNDVSGLEQHDICSFVASSGLTVIAMHAVSVPVVPAESLPMGTSAVGHIECWLERKREDWHDAGIDESRVIIDPGIGFGKTPNQSVELLANVKRLRSHGHRVAIGHSRKSFMNGFAPESAAERDTETLGISLSLANQGADIIRVHDPVAHIRAHRAAQQIHRRIDR